jgi:hypothetical protein
MKSIVCIAAIVPCKQIGMIRSLAPLDTNKAKKCMSCILPDHTAVQPG